MKHVPVFGPLCAADGCANPATWACPELGSRGELRCGYHAGVGFDWRTRDGKWLRFARISGQPGRFRTVEVRA